MRVLIIKLSSMGDIIHTLPALTDALRATPALRCDWVVEEQFQDIPGWMPVVENVIPIALRRWRKSGWWRARADIRAFLTRLRAERYDLVIDMQGLFKSGMVAYLARGLRVGLDYASAREKGAAFFYQRRCKVIFEQHAIPRARQLMAQALNYPLPDTAPLAQIILSSTASSDIPCTASTILLCHATTWRTKHWPTQYWHELTQKLNAKGHHILLPWSSDAEYQAALSIAAGNQATVLPKMSLTAIATLMHSVRACIAVDTGLGHLAAILGVPTVSIYGSTDPQLTGTLGAFQTHVSTQVTCAPCLKSACALDPRAQQPFAHCLTSVPVDRVEQAIETLLREAGR